MSLPRYAAYKPSDVEWFGELPSHWQAKRLKTEASYCVSNVDKVPSDEELPVRLCNYTDVYYNDQITPDMELMETTATAEEIRKFGLRVNDVLITKDSEEWSDIAVPAIVAETASDLVCGYHLAIIRPAEGHLHGKYLLRVFQSSAVNQQFQIAASGVTRYGLPKSSIGDAWLPFPPFEEQQTIAAFLDAQTAKIDTLLAKKRQFIDKLKEKRSALIARTVTCGLPPNAAQAAGLEPHPAMKDSGVEWLGQIPEHWEVKRLRYIGEAIIGLTYEPGDVSDEDDGTLVLRSSNVQAGKITFDDTVYVKKTIPKRLCTCIGDILICSRNGSRALIGKNAMIDERSAGLTFGAFMTIFRSPFSTYLHWVFNSNLFEFQSGAFLT